MSTRHFIIRNPFLCFNDRLLSPCIFYFIFFNIFIGVSLYLKTMPQGRVKSTLSANNELIAGKQMELCGPWQEGEPEAGWGVVLVWKLV